MGMERWAFLWLLTPKFGSASSQEGRILLLGALNGFAVGCGSAKREVSCILLVSSLKYTSKLPVLKGFVSAPFSGFPVGWGYRSFVLAGAEFSDLAPR